MQEQGRIIKVEGNQARVTLEPKEACRSCKLCQAGRQGEMIIQVENSIGARVGDQVKLEIEVEEVLRSAFLLYGLPLLGLLIGFLGGGVVIGSEPGIIGGGLTGLGLTFLGLHIYDKRLKKLGREKGVIVHHISAVNG
ncbi:MAG: SoxR reducing system RseC family protein [bacterium]|nr:SoxR reducing system RseC family protein [bacterium]